MRLVEPPEERIRVALRVAADLRELAADVGPTDEQVALLLRAATLENELRLN